MYQGSLGKFAKQLQYADRRTARSPSFKAQNERAEGKVQIKDMIEGKKEAAAIETNAEYRAARVGQYEVAVTDIVAEVKKALGRAAPAASRPKGRGLMPTALQSAQKLLTESGVRLPPIPVVQPAEPFLDPIAMCFDVQFFI